MNIVASHILLPRDIQILTISSIPLQDTKIPLDKIQSLTIVDKKIPCKHIVLISLSRIF